MQHNLHKRATTVDIRRDDFMVSYSRFSHHGRRALTHAGILTTQFRHPRVDTGHLLVGVMLTHGSIGSKVLSQLDFDVEQASVYLKSLTLPLDRALDNPPYDAALDSCLDLAADESLWLSHHYIGTEHLLLGITRTNVGNASDLLRLLGYSPDQLRRRVREALQEGQTEYTLETARRNAQLSELSKRVINAAEQLAIRFDHETVGIGHLLFVLHQERRSITATLLKAVNLNAEQVEATLQQRDQTALVSVEHVLAQAGEHAKNWDNHYIGTEHLLLAISTDDYGVLLLRKFDVDPQVMKRKVESQLRSGR